MRLSWCMIANAALAIPLALCRRHTTGSETDYLEWKICQVQEPV